jgi:HEAT repeat protein
MTEPASLSRRQVAIAGHRGDIETVRRGLLAADAAVRATALGALSRLEELDADALQRALDDVDPTVRRRGAQLAAAIGDVALDGVLTDLDSRVVEMAAWACGERVKVSETELDLIVKLATGHDDPLVREAAVAALGAIGDDRGLPAILAGTTDKPAIRRRAVIALTPFDGPLVDEAYERARADRDWQVRQLAEELWPNPEGP